MDYRTLGHSGFKVPGLAFGTSKFGGGKGFGSSNANIVNEASRLVDICLEAGVTMFDTADMYSDGFAEEILGQAIKGRRDSVILATKAGLRTGPGPNQAGSSRHHLFNACEQSLRRLGTDFIDLFLVHGFDTVTPVEESLKALDDLVRSGKVRYIGCSNFSGWHLMKSLGVSEHRGLARYVAHQAHYSLLSREFEWELMPVALDQAVGTMVWGPLGMGRLGGKYRRGQPLPPERRRADGSAMSAPAAGTEFIFRVVDALDVVARETGKTVTQIALNWLLCRPSVATVIVGARNETQLRENLGAWGWALTPEHLTLLDSASAKERIYPYWHQMKTAERNPFPTS